MGLGYRSWGAYDLENSEPEPGMRVLLRDVVSKRYFAGKGEWTEDANRAFLFRTTSEAIASAGEVGRDGLEIVVSFQNPFHSVVVPVGKAADPGGWRSERPQA